MVGKFVFSIYCVSWRTGVRSFNCQEETREVKGEVC